MSLEADLSEARNEIARLQERLRAWELQAQVEATLRMEAEASLATLTGTATPKPEGESEGDRAAATLALAEFNIEGGTSLADIENELAAVPTLEAALSTAPAGDGVAGMVLAAKDLLASLDPDTLNPEQFNAWSALSSQADGDAK